MIIDFILIGASVINILVIAVLIFKKRFTTASLLGVIQTLVWVLRLTLGENFGVR